MKILLKKNRNKILQAFSTLLRKKGKTVIPILRVNDPIPISTVEMNRASCSIGSFRTNSALFYSSNYEKELNKKDIGVLKRMIE